MKTLCVKFYDNMHQLSSKINQRKVKWTFLVNSMFYTKKQKKDVKTFNTKTKKSGENEKKNKNMCMKLN